MSQQIEAPARALLEEPNYAVLSVARADGTVQSVVVWQDPEDGGVAVNSAEGRDWPANLRRAKNATILVIDRENPYEWVSISGPLVQDTHDGANDHIDALSKKYIGQDKYPYHRPGEERVKFVIGPERVNYVKRG